MRLLNVPLGRIVGFALVLAHPAIDMLIPEWLSLSPRGAFEQSSCSGSREEQRERDQRVPDVLAALGVRPGAVVADVGAGAGFYTVRLARAVGDTGRVIAVDIDSTVLRNLRSRVEREALGNVDVVEGATDNPRLPEGQLDAALIVNAYHEMKQHDAMLGHLRRALKPGGRLVILEPITPSRRTESRAVQARSHEIASEIVLQDARAAGFKVASLEEPFSSRHGHGLEWLMVLTPAVETAAPSTDHTHEDLGDTGAADLRIGMQEFRQLQATGKVIVLDVRDESMFEAGHISDARLAPMDRLRDLLPELQTSGLPIVTYCSCPAEESSARAVLYLRKNGVSNARALTGGYEAWAKDGASFRLP
jgi:rhodanese-related sulfurtransferase/predicted methyltransferase